MKLTFDKTKLLNAKLGNTFNKVYDPTDGSGCLKCVFIQASLDVENPTDYDKNYSKYISNSLGIQFSFINPIWRKTQLQVCEVLDKYESRGYLLAIKEGVTTRDLLLNCIAELEEYDLVNFINKPTEQTIAAKECVNV